MHAEAFLYTGHVCVNTPRICVKTPLLHLVHSVHVYQYTAAIAPAPQSMCSDLPSQKTLTVQGHQDKVKRMVKRVKMDSCQVRTRRRRARGWICELEVGFKSPLQVDNNSTLYFLYHHHHNKPFPCFDVSSSNNTATIWLRRRKKRCRIVWDWMLRKQRRSTCFRNVVYGK